MSNLLKNKKRQTQDFLLILKGAPERTILFKLIRSEKKTHYVSGHSMIDLPGSELKIEPVAASLKFPELSFAKARTPCGGNII